ncbi:acetyl-CoA synthetase-like protein [Viridothelium virens]|uniref:Acetyl-CoA synthetase-like protein n=1 Tax=Viridothelium virens TaxID=1048519 RepID=A0A6A6HPT1_VIRVR|nr:acetyl-CoA synthetase-like protein [Viridothelium virens]
MEVEQRPPSIVYGPRSPVPLNLTFGQLLDHHAEVRPNSPAVISHVQSCTISFRQLQKRSIDLARAMAQAGIGKGSLVGIISATRYEYLEIFFACARLGAALILFNYAYTSSEILSLLKAIKPQMLFSPPGLARYDYNNVLQEAKSSVSRLRDIIILADIFRKYQLSSESLQHQDYESFLESRANSSWSPDSSISSHDMVNVQFTSGSTGLPKSVALSHYNIMNCGRNIWLQTRLTSEDRICCPVPLFHSFGMIVAISTSTVAGSSLVFPSELYDPAATLHCIERYKCTALYGVTTMFITEMAHPSCARTDKSSLKFGIVAGSAMPPEFLRRVMREFSIPRIYSCWGMTELSSFVTMMHETDPWDKRIHTTGRLFPHFILKIVKPNSGDVVPWGERGEIVVSGYGQMSEYLGNKEKTNEALRYHEQDLHEGGVGGLGGREGRELRRWMHTGDEGMLDDDGYLVFTGRIKDLIIRGGENITPLEIEERLSEMEAIEQASVVGVSDHKYGETVGAFLELKEKTQRPGDEEVRKWVRAKLAHFKAPVHIWWLGDDNVPEEWPKTMSGKISKPELRKMTEKLMEIGKSSKAKL